MEKQKTKKILASQNNPRYCDHKFFLNVFYFSPFISVVDISFLHLLSSDHCRETSHRELGDRQEMYMTNLKVGIWHCTLKSLAQVLVSLFIDRKLRLELVFCPKLLNQWVIEGGSDRFNFKVCFFFFFHHTVKKISNSIAGYTGIFQKVCRSCFQNQK